MNPAGLPLLGLLLFVASLVAIVTRRLNLPYSAGLVAAGLALALLPAGLDVPLTRELIFGFFLPPLIFEAAIQIPWAPLRRELLLLLVLATLGLLLAAGIVAAGMHWLVGWSWLGAGFFGILVAATDPVSVIAMFKHVPVAPRLQLLVEAESLLNDAVAAVGFAMLLALAAGGAASASASVPAIGATLLVSAGGGLAAGAVVALPLLAIARHSEDPLVEMTLTTLAAFGSFLLAEHFHASGVLAALCAGLLVGNIGKSAISDRPTLLAFWDYVAFLANSVIFILIGESAAHMKLLLVAEAGGAAILLCLAGRAATVYPIALLFARSSLRVPSSYQHVLWWGGLRGALALALALALPAGLAERQAIIAATFAVVAFSVFVQGLTMAPLVRRLGLIRSDDRS